MKFKLKYKNCNLDQSQAFLVIRQLDVTLSRHGYIVSPDSDYFTFESPVGYTTKGVDMNNFFYKTY